MSWTSIVIYALVACVGIPAAIRNATATGLVLAWLGGELIYIATGNSLPLSSFFMMDVAVISVIYAKTIRRVGAKTYHSTRHQLRCLVLDLTVYDRWVVALYLFAAWPLYVLAIHPFYKWWALYLVVVAQFLLAGAEAIRSLRPGVSARAASDPPGNGLALAGERRGHG